MALPGAVVPGSSAALTTFLGYVLIVFIIAFAAGRAGRGKPFVGEYYLGGRNFGMWAFALTYAATLASGGSFMGFPALIYTHGWSLAWWICGYMVVPVVAMGLFAKRLNQIGRIAGAITIPELLRKRFASNAVGNTATLLLLFFMFFYLLAQFRAGAMIMQTLFGGVPIYEQIVSAVAGVTEHVFWMNQTDPHYLVCLGVFGIAVVAYTAYGGFRAVVWTDVLQGLVMLVGVLLLLGMTLSLTGGLNRVTEKLAAQTPPDFGRAFVGKHSEAVPANLSKWAWVQSEDGEILRLADHQEEGKSRKVIIITSPEQRAQLASVAAANSNAVARIAERRPYEAGAGREGVYLSPEGPSASSAEGFLPVMLALSFFAFWNFSGAGQPSYMVRQMAFRDTVVLRHSILFVAIFFTLIYLPLILIFTSARVLLPGMEVEADRIMPEMARVVTEQAGVPWLAGILVAAPFAAIMSSVDSFLLLVSSGVVRDIYQQKARGRVSEKTVARLSRLTTVVVGVLAVIFALNPPRFLQTLIVFASGGLGATFLVPIILALYWKRMTATAGVAGMISGGLVMLAFYLIGLLEYGEFKAFSWLDIHPFVWASLVNLLVVMVVSRMGRRPAGELIEKYFGT
ncbi:MAG: hypothetical protein CMO40_03110 [Verrucomicrobiaceae bacterium]|nr:hypothetical protein [Verrucomicrobiaceae bacterium]